MELDATTQQVSPQIIIQSLCVYPGFQVTFSLYGIYFSVAHL